MDTPKHLRTIVKGRGYKSLKLDIVLPRSLDSWSEHSQGPCGSRAADEPANGSHQVKWGYTPDPMSHSPADKEG
jgi:hypothetical protein